MCIYVGICNIRDLEDSVTKNIDNHTKSTDYLMFWLQLISAVVQKDYKMVIENTALENWKEALAVILTYGKPGEFVQLCGEFYIHMPYPSLSTIWWFYTAVSIWILLNSAFEWIFGICMLSHKHVLSYL